ncbi:protein of unknown function [Beijerinckiaceae bacterium RH AL1]|nr:hypothetical protein [Beijerinckiaceae bacterium]VVB49405.1 protein of unknown function [Beijerinckiaceae bacterium RH CH11]VVB49486.1 protein of unknown function [Beijerinckiaceae bacterium RH AL8]VVC56886.1 protein of unknown function [Beijerinckiaceae bacterium RH AL1]
MSPFAALGLDEDADERAVKRAYATRLRSTRPDDDPVGFQALNAAYKAALGAIRRRAPAVEEEGEGLDSAAAPPAAPDAAPPSAPPEIAHDPPAAPVDGQDILFDYAAPRADGGIVFDFDAFLADVRPLLADPAADLHAWLEARMAAWPLAMKPTLAPYVLTALDDESMAVPPNHFDTLMAAFGVDDVLAGIDLLAVEQLRKANSKRWTRQVGAAWARHLLARENRWEFSVRVRGAGWSPLVARAIVHILTSRHAARWTALRWLPLPPMAHMVVKLLRYIGAGDVDAVSPPIEPIVLARWQRAERTVGKINFGLLFAVGWLAVLALGVVYNAMDQDSPEGKARDRIAAIRNEEELTPLRAVDDYTNFVAAYPPPRSDLIAKDVAIAMLNKGVVLHKMGRENEAIDAFRELEETFGNSNDTGVSRFVAMALNNWASIQAERKDYQVVLRIVHRVVDRYPLANDEEQGDQSFDVQVARALITEADALEHLGDREATLATYHDLLGRFPYSWSDQMKDLVSTARDFIREHDHDHDSVGAIVPSQGQSPPQAAQPVGGTAKSPNIDLPTTVLPKN